MIDSVAETDGAGELDASEEIDVSRLFRLDGRVALVTGGTRGIGRAVAEGFGRAGARVVVASRKPEACQETERALRSAGIDAAGIACHMGSMEDVRALVAATAERFGAIDVVVNNAANALTEPISNITEAGVTKTMDVNVKGHIFLVHESTSVPPGLETMPSVINLVSAGACSIFSATVAHYAAARSRHESRVHQGARRRPGSRRYPGERARSRLLLGHGHGAPDRTGCHRQHGRRLPDAASGERPPRWWGRPLFLASDASSYVTGTIAPRRWWSASPS